MTKSPRASSGRRQASADEIGLHIRKYTSVVPGLERVSIEVVRVVEPDDHGCNWMAKHSRIPVGCMPESERLLYDIIENTQAHFNLWDLH